MSSRPGSRETDKGEVDCERIAKMARLGRKYVALFELAAVPGPETDPVPSDDWASRVLRLIISANWADPSFLEELAESALIGTMCRVLPLLKANAANRATASCIQDLADLEEALRKLRHELALAEKRLPNHGVLGSGGSSYTTWASVGHVCTLILQALSHSSAAAQTAAVATSGTPRPSPTPLGAGSSRASPAPPVPPVRPPAAGGGGSSVAAPAVPEHTENGANGNPGLTAAAGAAAAGAAAAAAGAAAAAASDSPSGASTPGGSASKQHPGGGSIASPGATMFGVVGTGGNPPALATEGALLKLLGNKHVVLRAKEVLRVVPERYKAALSRVILSHIYTELKATQSALTHILQILKGDPAATTPAPSSLPKTWFNTAAVLTAYQDTLASSIGKAAATVDETTTASTAKSGRAPSLLAPTPAGSARAGDTPAGRHDADGLNGDTGGIREAAGTVSNGDGQQSGREGGGSGDDVEMAEALPPAANQQRDADSSAAGAVNVAEGVGTPVGPSSRNGSPAGAGADASAVRADEALGADAERSSAAAAAAAAAADDPRVMLAQLLEDVASALCEAVTGAHSVGRVALLLRGEATGKYPSAAAYMPSALSINELMAQLDALACVATALSAGERLRPVIGDLLASAAMKELLGAGKVYVTTVIAAGALTRDLRIDAVIPQSLRQGYMAAVLAPLETGALLNERRAPQVLAYRSSITESSFYQVMDADALPYGINVRFEDEQEAEGMGVVREWLSQIAADIFSTERGLFVRGAADRRVVHPAPHSRLQEDYLGYMRFAGRIVGLALRANVPLGVVLSTGLFNYLTGGSATLTDLQQLDPQVYSTCQNILATPGAEALELFHVWHGQAGGGSADSSSGSGGGGQLQEQELVPGGASLRVTDANKAAYVELLAQHLVVTLVEEQCAAFLAGVQDTAHHLPDDARLRRAFLAPLLLDDLNRITAGESVLDPEDWAEHTDVAGFESAEEQESMGKFWQLVSEYSPEERQRLLQFWTAMTHLPSGGFKALNQRLQIMKLGPSPAVQQGRGNAVEPPTPAGGPLTAPSAVGTAAANGHGGGLAHGHSADGAGPHSHRLDGESLEAEEQEQSDASEELAEDGAAPRPPTGASQGSAEQAAVGAGAGAVAAQPPDGTGHGGSSGEQEGAGGAGASPTAAAGVEPGVGSGASAARSDSLGRPNGLMEDEEMPYAEEEDEEGEDGGGSGSGAEDGMEYGDEEEEELDEDELFQRQLALALELSLQDMPPPAPQDPEPQRAAPPLPSGHSTAGAVDAGGAAGGGDGGEQAADGVGGGSSDGQASQTPGAATAREEDEEARGMGQEAGAAEHAEGLADGSAGTDAAVRTTVAAGAPEPGAQSASADTASPSQAAPARSGADDESPPADGGSAAANGGPSAEDSSLPLTPPAGGGSAPTEAMETEASGGNGATLVGAASSSPGAENPGAEAAGGTTAVSDEGVPAGAGSQWAEGPIQQQQGPGAGAGGQSHQEEDPDQGQQGGEGQRGGRGTQGAAASSRAQQPRQDAQQVGGEEPGPHTPQQQLQPRDLEQELEQMAMRMNDSPEGLGAPGPSEGALAAASVPPQSATKALPLLPQARTCFLQLNLPVYDNIEDMRRALAIALDNMSFGLH